MACQYPSSRIVTLISHPDSGNHYKMLWTLEKDGKDTYHWWNSLTITVTMPILRQHRLKHFMVEMQIRQRLQAARNRQRSYANVRRKLLEFQVGDRVMLKVSPRKELRLNDKLNFVEEPVEVMDREIKQLRQSRIPIVKVRWNSNRGPEFTWERTDIKEKDKNKDKIGQNRARDQKEHGKTSSTVPSDVIGPVRNPFYGPG
ncbi:hypothetical protein Tco_0954174 [Tanacetum coccineum]|uniref:Reverse transcriptase domain-containing protein n=1 Tax=Tanacetum coccineum TaxID=301880 RepID=A0ABQ5E4F4_9ASTR